MNLTERITINTKICHGKPTIRGLRYPVEMILELLSSGMTADQILADYEDLERDDILAACHSPLGPDLIYYGRTQRGKKMAETSIPIPPGFTDMSKAEQVRYLQSLWDHIADSPGEIPVPDSHLQLAEERLKRYRNDPSTARSAFEVLDRLTQKPK